MGKAWIVTRDGVARHVAEDENSAHAWLLRAVPYSTDHAMRYEGWAIVTPEPWEADKARDLTSSARYVLRYHGHDGHTDDLTRENCGACVLAGFGADENGPNYAGWARIYVEASHAIPAAWRDAFMRELNSENRAYADALARDLATYGLR